MFQKDSFRASRGNYSRFLEITCRKCKTLICYYQKDGAGELRRMYVDRMHAFEPEQQHLQCPACDHLLGMKIEFEKEQRPAYAMFVGGVTKKVVSASNVK